MKIIFTRSFVFILFLLCSLAVTAQTGTIRGRVISEGSPLPQVNISIGQPAIVTTTDSAGFYELTSVKAGSYKVQASAVGFKKMFKSIALKPEETLRLDFDLSNFQNDLNEVVVTGTLKEVNRLESPVPVEVYTPAFFRKNPTPSIFDALQNVNGVRPQLNCNICNTGDIHINGLEGPYTMILINPPTASLPYKEEAGPFTISICSTREFGIPERPYTVDKLLTIGIPSIKIMV